MKSKNFSFCIALAVLLFEISAFASTTRVRSMGDVGLIFRDHSNIWLFPSNVTRFGNLVILELGGQRELIDYLPAQAGFDPSGGALISFGVNQQHVIGGFFGDSSERLPFAPVDPITGQPVAMNRRMDLFYGMNQAHTSFGWQLTYASGGHQSSSTFGSTNNARARLLGLAFGVTHASDKSGTLDATLRYEYHSYEVMRASRADERSRGGHHVNLLSRWVKTLNERVEIVPFLGFAIGSDGRDLGNSQTEDLTQSRIFSGTGLNFQPDSINVFSLGFSLLRARETTTTDFGTSAIKLTQTTWRLPFVFGGVETTLFKCLQVRFGFQKALQSVSRKTRTVGLASNDESEDKRSEGPFELAFGLGIHHRQLTIDFSLDPDYFKR
ncbi:MAG: hypothetical protein ONB44_21500, partial [candidate division KSB1 bacterium]|nr:hypothetical protein [candidate division KSB1 bacterium]